MLAENATARVRDLLDPSRYEQLTVDRGYLDVLGDVGNAPTSPALSLMNSRLFATVYERFWRPTFTRLFSIGGSATEHHDRQLVDEVVTRGAQQRILDVACGPGLFTRDFGAGLSEPGVAVGLDFSPAMLAQAVRQPAPDVAYVRADAHHIPFPDDTFDAVVCLAALYLIPDPLPVIDEMARVTVPGGEVVVFTSLRTALASFPPAKVLAQRVGYTNFRSDEITNRFTAAGLVDVTQTKTGVGQYVRGRKPR